VLTFAGIVQQKDDRFRQSVCILRGTAFPTCFITFQNWVSGAAHAITGLPLASMVVSLDGMTKSAAPAR